MNKFTSFDLVWLGLLIGVFDLVDRESGMRELLEHLEDIGLSDTKAKLQAEEEFHEAKFELWMLGGQVPDATLPDEHNRQFGEFESDDIASWVSEEIHRKKLDQDTTSRLDIHDTTDLINSMRPGVWAHIPDMAQQDFVEAEKSIKNGQLKGAALLLGGCVEAMVSRFYEGILPLGDTNITWERKEKALLDLGDRTIIPAVRCAQDLRLNHRNPATHGGKAYDSYDIIELWHMSVLAVSRMATILDRRSALPGDPGQGHSD